MRKKNNLRLAILVFLLFTAAAIFFVLERNKDNSFEIKEGNQAINNNEKIPADKSKNNTPAPTVPKEENKNTDWTWAIEKYKGKEISKISTQDKKVALTFDAGANADGVDKILPILAENNIKGTFFLTGKFIEKYPDKVKEIIARGGDIGNHSYDHPYFTKLTNDQIKDEIQKTETALGKLDGKFLPFLRSPYGDRNSSTLSAISDNGYINIRWTIDSLGWEGTSGGMSKDLVEQKVLKNTVPGAIIMMHLGSNPDDKTHLDSQALPDIIAKLKEDGYEFVTLSQLIELQK
jgi:peptidoglycan/xylan/chitin deacetylase (PgdA/CDA1 family)